MPAGLAPKIAAEVSKVLSQRNLLGTLGVAVAGGAVAMVSYREDAQAATTPAGAKGPAHAWRMVIDLRTWPRTPAADGVDLNVAIRGSGPALVLLHGFPQTHYMWRHAAQQLATRYTVIVPDLGCQ